MPLHQARALGLATWLEEALPECELDELYKRMRRETSDYLLGSASGSMLLLVSAGEFRFTADPEIKGRVRRASARGELLSDATLRPGDCVVIGSAGEESLFATIYETYQQGRAAPGVRRFMMIRAATDERR